MDSMSGSIIAASCPWLKWFAIAGSCSTLCRSLYPWFVLSTSKSEVDGQLQAMNERMTGA
jgi:hypothetical protein